MTGCLLCGKPVRRSGEGQHWRRCLPGLSRAERRFVYLRAKFPVISVKDVLYEEYSVKELSLPDLRRIYGIDYKATIYLLDHYRIARRSHSSAARTGRIRTKSQETCMKLYGTTNPLSKGTECCAKRDQTVRARYAVDNVFQTETVKRQCADDNTFLERYGRTRSEHRSMRTKEWIASLTPDARAAWLKVSLLSEASIANNRPRGYRVSQLEHRVAACLGRMAVPYATQFRVGRKFFDLYLPLLGLLIEVQGDYWHANPLNYLPDDLVHFRFARIRASDIWK